MRSMNKEESKQHSEYLKRNSKPLSDYAVLGEVLKIIDSMYINKNISANDNHFTVNKLSDYAQGRVDTLNLLKEKILSIST